MFKRIKEDRGDSNTISMIFIVFILMAILLTVIDAGLYFNNRYIIANAAQNGARTAAIFGGTTPNNISAKYGITSSTPECISFGAESIVECSVYNELKESKQSVNVNVTSIKCGPGATTKIGDRTYCEIEYDFNGTPGSGMALAKFFGHNRVRMTAESEVVHSSH